MNRAQVSTLERLENFLNAEGVRYFSPGWHPVKANYLFLPWKGLIWFCLWSWWLHAFSVKNHLLRFLPRVLPWAGMANAFGVGAYR